MTDSIDSRLKKPAEKRTSVVYGVYDRASQPFGVKVNDFLIDRQRVKIKEKSYFFHLMGVMLDAGIPITKALRVLSHKSSNQHFSRIINTMAYDVERGKKMRQSMLKFPEVFTDSEVGVIESGEAIGNLSQLLFKLGVQTARTHELMTKVRSALTYPIVVIVALLVSGGIVVQMVIPKLNDFFVSGGFEMPPLTQFILSAGAFFVQFSWLIVALVLLAGVFVSFYSNTEAGKRRVAFWALSLPWVGDVLRKVSVARFVQTLSLLVESGVPIHEALRISAEAIDNVLYKDYLRALKRDVEKGEKISDNLAEVPFLFPESVVAMISVGENTGQLSAISDKLAEHYEQEVKHSLDNFTTLLEPAVIVMVGVAVGILALALLGPIFSLSSTIA
jgi:type IV pilus assembly protein PilC